MEKKGISIVVPILNEEGNLVSLVRRIHTTLVRADIAYEIIFIDDHSTDRTRDVALLLAKQYPILFFMKQGKRGKAYSLLEGFSHASGELCAMIDGDLQYPPEAIPEMVKKIRAGAAVVVADRAEQDVSLVRRFMSKGFVFFFARVLHGFRMDVQSGLKVFRREILSEMSLDPRPWSFDLGFLLQARNAGHHIETVSIAFAERDAGSSKLRLFRAITEIGLNAIGLKLAGVPSARISPTNVKGMIGAGVASHGKRFITHTILEEKFSALHTFTVLQKIALTLFTAVFVAGFFSYPLTTAIIAMAFLSVIYFADALFHLYIVMRSLSMPPELRFSKQQIDSLHSEELPVYSILCPLYREAHVLPGFLKAIDYLNWPKEKLDILLLLEEDDCETINVARSMKLPDYVRIVIVPDGLPKTKPKACNFGLSIARGEYLVVYDAEDIPEPDQLKKAHLGFQTVSNEVKCLQAKLNYYNPEQNILTRFFTAEYSLWFETMLTGLQSINTTIPLGGTSNHFRTRDLVALRGWDPFNVTEDCDLGIRLFKQGYRTAIIDSVTLEEANSNLWNWIRQRSRWIKGYMQTYLVHMRRPGGFVRESGFHALVFQLNVGGKILFTLINPILWIATVSYFVLNALVGETIEALYPTPIFYMATFSLVFGNFTYLYYYMIGCAKRGHWTLMKYVFFVPLYWLLMSIAGLIALYQLFMKPHYWEKTHHGLVATRIPRAWPRFAQFSSRFGAFITGSAVRVWYGGFLHLRRYGIRAKSRVEYILRGIYDRALEFFPRDVFKGASMLIGAMMVANVLNFLFNAFLGRVLGYEELGVVIFINTLWLIAMIGTSALSSTVNHKTAALAAQSSKEENEKFFRTTWKRTAVLSIMLVIAWVSLVPWFTKYFNIGDESVLYFFTPVIIFGILGAVQNGFLRGNLYFIALAAVVLAEAGSKFLFAFLFVVFNQPLLVHLAVPLSIVFAGCVSFAIVFAKLDKQKSEKIHQYQFPKNFFNASFMTGLSITVFLTLDIVLAKHFLSPQDAGQYVLLSIVGKIIYFLGSLPNAFMITFVSRMESLGKSSRAVLHLLFGSSVALTLAGFLAFGVLGSFTVPLLLGAKTLPILALLLPYTLAISLLTLTNALVLYYLARKEYLLPRLSFFFALLMAMGIIAHHETVRAFVEVIVWVSVLFAGTVAVMHFLKIETRFVIRAFKDLKDAFFPIPSEGVAALLKKRILIFNWRDIRHLYAGGAEVYIHELAKHWVRDGNRVTIFSGNDGKSRREEVIDGVEIVRRGGFYFVYAWAFIYYFFQFRGKYDVIIDSENGVPFFTPLYVKEPVYCLMHHIHQEVFRRSLAPPLARFAMFLEKDLMPLVYRRVKFITVSESSKRDIEAIGLGRAGIITVTPGVDLERLTAGEKNKTPLILYLGRLKAYKSIHVLIGAFRIVMSKVHNAHLVIAGGGDEERALKTLVRGLGLGEHITFLGKISEEEKVRLLQSAWMLVNPSMMEGWGITTIEANACGTPMIASDVPGLRDSVQSKETGYLVPYGDARAFAEKIIELVEDHELRERMSKKASLWAENFDWSRCSQQFIHVIESDTQIPVSAVPIKQT